MKKLFILCVFSFIYLPGISQEERPRKMKYIVKSGLTFPMFSYKMVDNIRQEAYSGYYLGASAILSLSKIWSIESGFSMINKGNKTFTQNYSEQINLVYLEIPTNLVANIHTSVGRFFAGAGPYLGFGLTGNILQKTYRQEANGVVTLSTVKKSEMVAFDISSADDTYQMIDFGFNFLLGYELKQGFGVCGGYGLGMTNVYKQTINTQKTMNRGFSVGLFFRF